MKNKALVIVLLQIFFSGCIEEVPIETELQSNVELSDLLVVDALLTNEVKAQEIRLSRTTSFAEGDTLKFEENATVQILDSQGNSYDFFEDTSGIYRSTAIFGAQRNVEYQLQITTSDGETYESSQVQSQADSSIDAIYAERIVSDNGIDGMAIYVDSSSDTAEGRFFRYTYEETYKIIAPSWTASEFEILQEELEVIVDENTGEVINILYPDVQLVPRQQEERVCYNTVNSTAIILASSASLSGSTLNRNLVRFINAENPILSHRYSILVKQFLHSENAFSFYQTLNNIASEDDILSQIQPGFVEGNIENLTNPSKRAIGFFDVVSITEQRIFFNYDDFFPGEPLPPYFDGINCDIPFSPALTNPERDGPTSLDECGFPRPLIEYIQFGEVEFFEDNTVPPPICEGPYLVVQRICGDCTVLGTNVVPEFWTEE